MTTNLTPGWILTGVFAALSAGSLARLVSLRGKPKELVRQRVGSLGTWWVVVPLFASAVLLGQMAVAVLFVLIGDLALREYARLIPASARDRTLERIAPIAVPIHYALICLGGTELAIGFIPIVMLIVFSLSRTLVGRTTDFTSAVSAWCWGLLLLVYAPSHAVMLWSLPESWCAEIGPVGWFVYLLILTEMNDIAQAFFGRHWGKRRIVPAVSPFKTWTGLIGGVLTTITLAVVLAPVLTPFELTPEVNHQLITPGWLHAVAAGLLIAVMGFLGDINLSAVKRDAGVKDSGTLLPGQGGVLDRFDSLTFTAPAFYCFVLWTMG